MNLRIHSRKTAWFLTVLAVLFVLASAFFPAFACHHICSGSCCPICMQIHTWTHVLRLFGACILCMLVYLAGQLFVCCTRDIPAGRMTRNTPVALKTKLLN